MTSDVREDLVRAILDYAFDQYDPYRYASEEYANKLADHLLPIFAAREAAARERLANRLKERLHESGVNMQEQYALNEAAAYFNAEAEVDAIMRLAELTKEEK